LCGGGGTVSRGSAGLRRLGWLATGLGLALVAAKARRGSRDDRALVGARTGPLVGVPGAEPVVEVAPEPVAEVESEPEPFVDAPAEPAPELWPTRRPWELRARARIERLVAMTLHHRRVLITICALALAVTLLIAVPAVVRTRGSDRWERCVKRTTGTTLARGGHVPQVVLDGCGPRPTTYRVPADRRN
jgi:hypothetical protein